ncbi:hypothetical protein ACET3Z_012295 [Daucus carota]
MVSKGLISGAPAYLLKPITVDAVRYLWHYSELWKNKEREAYKRFTQASIPRSICSSSCSCTKDAEVKLREKKVKEPLWTSQLHSRFVEVMLILGPRDSVPKNILEKMNVHWLTREQVASHLQKFRKYLASILDGRTSLEDSSKYWIDYKYYSTIVRGNPNQILVNQLLEQRRTGKSAKPIEASGPLPPYEEAEDMLIPNNYASSSNVASHTPVTLESFGNVAMPTLQQGGVTSQSGDVNVAMPTAEHCDLTYFLGAGNLKLKNVVESSSAYNDIMQNLNNEANQTSHYNQITVVPPQDNYLANTTLQLANTQFGPTIATSFDANQLGDPLWANQQLGDFQLDPSIGNFFGGPSEFGNMAALVQFGGGAKFADGGWVDDNQTELNHIPPAADNPMLDINPNLNQNQGEDWDDFLRNLGKD